MKSPGRPTLTARSLLPIALSLALPYLTAAENRSPSSQASQDLSLSLDGQYLGASDYWTGGDPRARGASGTSQGLGAQPGGYLAPLELRLSLPPEPALVDWLNECLRGTTGNHTLTTSEGQGPGSPAPVSYGNVRVTKINFPALNGASRDAALLSLSIQVGQRSAGGTAPRGIASRGSHGVLSSNFSVNVEGIQESSYIREVGSLVVEAGNGSRPQIGTLTLVINPAHASRFLAWRDAALSGAGGAAKKIELRYLSANMRESLLTLQLSGAMPLRVSRLPESGNLEIEVSVASAELLGDGKQATAGKPTQADKPTAVDKSGETGSSEDQGLRDPKGFPRPAGLVRERFGSAVYASSTREEAGYHSDSNLDELLESYQRAAKEAGWERTTINESGNTPDSRLIITEWRTANAVADLRFYGAKKGCKVSLLVTTFTRK